MNRWQLIFMIIVSVLLVGVTVFYFYRVLNGSTQYSFVIDDYLSKDMCQEIQRQFHGQDLGRIPIAQVYQVLKEYCPIIKQISYEKYNLNITQVAIECELPLVRLETLNNSRSDLIERVLTRDGQIINNQLYDQSRVDKLPKVYLKKLLEDEEQKLCAYFVRKLPRFFWHNYDLGWGDLSSIYVRKKNDPMVIYIMKYDQPWNHSLTQRGELVSEAIKNKYSETKNFVKHHELLNIDLRFENQAVASWSSIKNSDIVLPELF